MTETEQQTVFLTLFEAPKVELPEFRLYYDSEGKVLFYTCDKPEGNFIIVDKETFAIGNPHVIIIDGKITRAAKNQMGCKLMPDDIEGILCAAEDISLIIDESENIESIRWKYKIYELQ